MMYGAWVNLGGLGVVTPVKLCWNKSLNSWWVDEGEMKDNFGFEKIGLHVCQYGCVSFASKNKQEVQAFIDGARAVATVLFKGIPQLEVEVESEDASLS